MAASFAASTTSPSHPHLLLPLPRPRPTKTLALPQIASDLSLSSPATLAVVGGGSLAALAAALSLSDPDRRRRRQADLVGGGDKDVVRDYFNNTGFQRWRKIYGESTDNVNTVQLDIRLGHSKTVHSTINLLKDPAPLAGVTICDAGCGTGSLAIPLAREGALVSASDISAAMVAEAESKAAAEAGEGFVMPRFQVSDLEGLEGRWDTVVCLDVLIHYPKEEAEGMIAHLASLAERRLVVSFAPKTVYYDVLKRIGELFPGPSKATRAYLHREEDVEAALERVGWRVTRRDLISSQFYFSKLLLAIPATAAA